MHHIANAFIYLIKDLWHHNIRAVVAAGNLVFVKPHNWEWLLIQTNKMGHSLCSFNYLCVFSGHSTPKVLKPELKLAVRISLGHLGTLGVIVCPQMFHLIARIERRPPLNTFTANSS